MSSFNIEVVENGFIVRYDDTGDITGKTFVFQSPEQLADHVESWAGLQHKGESE